MADQAPDEVRLTARPFVKWAGGKRQLLDELLKHARPPTGTYHEPFVGGGALFFALSPERAVLSDSNERLIRTYRGIRDDVEGVVGLLGDYSGRHDKHFYQKMRTQDIDKGGDVEVAAWLIYLNRTGYNGLYRVNSRGKFNVPLGSYENPTICDRDNLRACSAALQHAELCCEDFAAVLDRAQPGDFVYFDPPYVPLSGTSSFTSYTRSGFALDDQTRLRNVALELKGRGVQVLLSNSSSHVVRELYRDGFEVEEVAATRLINSKAGRRGKIAELLIR